MKRAALLLSFFLLVANAFRREASSQPNLVRQIAPGVYFREAEPEKRIIANTGWIVFRDYVVVVDANFPWGARAVLDDLKKTTDKPIRYVFDTHYHSDHAFGNSVFVDAGATVVCSEDCAAESKEKNVKAWAADRGTGAYSLKPYRLEHPQIIFRDRLVVDDGQRHLELLRVGPAHTRGDAVAYLPRERVLFAGDLVINGRGVNLADPDSNPDGWVRALDDLALKDVALVVPGHGPQGTLETIRGVRAYLAEMVSQVRAGIARGAAVEQLEREIDLNLKRHNPWGQDEARNRTSIRIIYARLRR